MTAQYTKDPAAFAYLNFLLLQASTEQLVYGSMFCRHLSTWLDLQGRSPKAATRLRHAAAHLMTGGAILGPLQKLGPLVAAFYVLCHTSFEWLAHNPFNRTAGVAMLTLEIPLLIFLAIMQVRIVRALL